MKPLHQRFASFFLPALLALAGCGKPAPPARAKFPPPEPPLVSKAAPGRYGGELKLVCLGDPRTFNPILAADNSSLEISQWLFSTLTRMNFATQEIEPALAESWQTGPDQKTWTIKLRRGVHWSDGHPLTADDVVFTWNEIIYNPDIPSQAADLFRIRGKPFVVTKLDDYTVQFVTPEVFAPLPEFVSLTPVLPKHALAAAAQAKQLDTAYAAGTRPEQIVCSGPFKLKQHSSGRFVVLERNPEYWVTNTKGGRLPYFAHVIYTVTSDAREAGRLARKGECQIYERPKPEECEALKKEAGSRVQIVEAGVGLDREFVWFNLNTGTNPATSHPLVSPVKLKWFRNTKFRQAVSCAIDRDRITREVYGGHAVANHGFLSAENRRWNNPNIPNYGYDLNRARQLLADIGLKDRNGDGGVEDDAGNAVEFTFNTNEGNAARQRTAILIHSDLQKLGLRVGLQFVPFQALVEKINETFDYECILMGLGGGSLDPTSQMNVLRSDDALHQWFPRQVTPSTEWEARVDELMDAQLHTLDFAQRKKFYDEVQVILAEQLPMIYTVSPIACVAVNPKIGNIRPMAIATFRATWNLEELFFQ